MKQTEKGKASAYEYFQLKCSGQRKKDELDSKDSNAAGRKVENVRALRGRKEGKKYMQDLEINKRSAGPGAASSYVRSGEIVEHDGERAEGEEHVDLGLEDDDAHAGERPPPPAPGRERLGHGGERADVLEVQRVHLPGRKRRRRARRRRQLQLHLVRLRVRLLLEPQRRLLLRHHHLRAPANQGPRRRIRATTQRERERERERERRTDGLPSAERSTRRGALGVVKKKASSIRIATHQMRRGGGGEERRRMGSAVGLGFRTRAARNW